jgi:hypothetical protein
MVNVRARAGEKYNFLALDRESESGPLGMIFTWTRESTWPNLTVQLVYCRLCTHGHLHHA